GLYPAGDAARSSVGPTLKDESGQSSATAGWAAVRKAPVCAQAMGSAGRVTPAGVVLEGPADLVHGRRGVNTGNGGGVGGSPSRHGYKSEQCRALLERAEAELAAIPGARAVATALVPLIAGNNWGNSIRIEGASQAINSNANALMNEIGPGYFGKMGIALIA